MTWASIKKNLFVSFMESIDAARFRGRRYNWLDSVDHLLIKYLMEVEQSFSGPVWGCPNYENLVGLVRGQKRLQY